MNKKAATITITLALIGLGLYLWNKKRAAQFFPPEQLEEPLKSYYFKLKEKGYNPKTNPITHPKPFVTFEIDENGTKTVVVVNSLSQLLITENGKMMKPIVYNGKEFLVSNKTISDNKDLFDGVLEIVMNRNYTA